MQYVFASFVILNVFNRDPSWGLYVDQEGRFKIFMFQREIR